MESSSGIWLQISLGDEAAYEEMYLHYYKKFYVYGQKISNDPALVEDSIQEVMIYIWQNRKNLSGIENPAAYFFTFFRNLLFRKLRKQGIHLDESALPEESTLSSENQMIEKESDFQEKNQLRKAFSQLTPRQYEAILLRFYQGLSYEQIAGVMGISVKAAYKLMARSLGKLKNNYLPIILSLYFFLKR